MPQQNAPLLAFNRGIVSPKALARTDVERIRLSAEIMENWVPKTQGMMRLRPGLGYVLSNPSNNYAIDIPFVASTTDSAIIELSDSMMRIIVDDALITFPSVSTTVTTGDFSSSTGWTDDSSGAGTSGFGASGLTLNAGGRGGVAAVYQQVTVSGGDAGVLHSLRINVTRGPVVFRCGSTLNGSEYLGPTTLDTGVHCIGITPSGNFYVQFETNLLVDKIVSSCTVGSSGTMELDTPWDQDCLDELKWDQSADVVFVACGSVKQRRIERRGTYSWSVVEYRADVGPFTYASDPSVQMKSGANEGNTTLTADRPFFTEGMVGTYFQLFSENMSQTVHLSGNNSYTDPIEVTGISAGYINDRNWTYSISGTWSGTLNWFRSFDSKDYNYKIFQSSSGGGAVNITTNKAATGNDDDQDNAIVWYRLGFEDGKYTSGSASVSVDYPNDSKYGIGRVTAFNSSVSVDIEVIRSFGDTAYTKYWDQSIWSDESGWPTEVVLYDSRLWWFGRTRLIGSAVDAYNNFSVVEDSSDTVEGDSAPIIRTLGAGPVDVVNFALPLQRLIIGTDGTEWSINSSQFDEPLTGANMNAKAISAQGSKTGRCAVKVDTRGLFIQRSGKKLFEIYFDVDTYNYVSKELTILCPDITGNTEFKGLAVQRQPDTRIHLWCENGDVIVFTYDPDQDLVCWSKVDVGGEVEGVVVVPGSSEDRVYYRVKRTINSSVVRYLEKWALESESVGGDVNKMFDSFKILTGSVTKITGADHLEGESVGVWADGSYIGDYTITSGESSDFGSTYSSVVYGKKYTAQWKSVKLAYAAQQGTALAQRKKIDYLALILGTYMNGSLKYGKDFGNLEDMPQWVDGEVLTAYQLFEEYDYEAFTFPGEWDTDSRLHLEAYSPLPCEVLAAIVTIETHESS